jgi:glutamyl/glutaminyl-tRNA synthetase
MKEAKKFECGYVENVRPFDGVVALVAPSPTGGVLHLGGLRRALCNHQALCKKAQGQMDSLN